MKLQIRNATLAILGLITSQALVFGTMPAQAQTYSASVTKAQPSKTKQFFQKHDTVRKATIGAGVGTAAGAVTGLVAGKGMVRGAAIGAGTGAAIGVSYKRPWWRQNNYERRSPWSSTRSWSRSL